jgi:hypothetical protein
MNAAGSIIKDSNANDELSWEKGITSEWLLQCLNEVEKDIRGFLFKKLFMQDLNKLEWVNRYYGSYNEFYREVLQELTLYSLERIHNIPQNCTYKHIFWNLRHVMGKCLYRNNPEIYDFASRSEEGDIIGFYLDNLADDYAMEQLDYAENMDNLAVLIEDIENAKLSDSERQVIKRYFFDEMDYKEISKKLHITYSAVASACNTALHKLRIYLSQKHNIAHIYNPKDTYTKFTKLTLDELQFIKDNWEVLGREELLHMLNKNRDSKIGRYKLKCAAIELGLFTSESKYYIRKKPEALKDALTCWDRNYIRKSFRLNHDVGDILSIVNMRKDHKISIAIIEKFIQEEILTVNKSNKPIEFSAEELKFLEENAKNMSCRLMAIELNKNRQIKMTGQTLGKYIRQLKLR